MSTILAVDGNSLSHRAFHAYGPRSETDPGLRNSKGEPSWAVYGFLLLLAKITSRSNATNIIVGFDDHKKSVRKEKWPSYKAQRQSKGPELYLQMDTIREILQELKIQVIVASGLEADDVMASAAKAIASTDDNLVIATSDRDSFALINKQVTVMRLLSGLDNAVMLTPEKLYETYSIKPEQYLQFAALRGDPSDNLPGVKGIGEKTAVKILDTFSTVENAYLNLEQVEILIGKACARRLAEGKELFDKNMQVMEVNREIPINLDNTFIESDLSEVLQRHEMPSLVNRYLWLQNSMQL